MKMQLRYPANTPQTPNQSAKGTKTAAATYSPETPGAGSTGASITAHMARTVHTIVAITHTTGCLHVTRRFDSSLEVSDKRRTLQQLQLYNVQVYGCTFLICFFDGFFSQRMFVVPRAGLEPATKADITRLFPLQPSFFKG
jgi:hypothetical protein